MGVQKSQQDPETEKKPIGRPRKVKPVIKKLSPVNAMR